MDVRNNKIIVGDKSTIMLLDPNGSRLWTSEVRTVYAIWGVTSDKEGNVLLTDGFKTIQKYNTSGVMILEFGNRGHGEGHLNSPRGICLDTSGRIIVANSKNNRVDMFTSQGEFVRTIADISCPEAVAMGPCGELVVTSTSIDRSFTRHSKITILPRHMVLQSSKYKVLPRKFVKHEEGPKKKGSIFKFFSRAQPASEAGAAGGGGPEAGAAGAVDREMPPGPPSPRIPRPRPMLTTRPQRRGRGAPRR
ncbi:hypothetical protein Bbelb_287910 [Branchiostoma belcheri]|nr:hypothetical protein Bbelb_287910 [Branchiostoma belcheri]